MNEVEVLRNDRSSWAREIQGKAVLDGTEVVQFEDQVFWEVHLISPYDPADADVGKTEFVTANRQDQY